MQAAMKYMFALVSKTIINGALVMDEHEMEILGMGLFRWFCMFNHSCRPTASFRMIMNENKTWEVEVRALQKLKPGEEITISYIDVLVVSIPDSRKFGFWMPGGDRNRHIKSSEYERVSFVETRRKDLRDRYCFDCNCEECAADLKAIDKHGFDPLSAFYCVKYPKCKGLNYLPITSRKVNLFNYHGGYVKCKDCGYEVFLTLEENYVREDVGLPAMKVKDGSFNPEGPVYGNIITLQESLDEVKHNVNLDAKSRLQHADSIYENLTNITLLAHPYERNWEMLSVLLEIVDVYCSPDTWFVPVKSLELTYKRFQRMIKVIPYLDRFYGCPKDNTNTYSVKWVFTVMKILKYGMQILNDFDIDALPAKKAVELISKLMPLARRAFNMAKILYGTDVKRSAVLREIDVLEGDLTILLTYNCQMHKIPISKELMKLMRPVEQLTSAIESLRGQGNISSGLNNPSSQKPTPTPVKSTNGTNSSTNSNNSKKGKRKK